MTKAGYTVLPATNGAEAVEPVRSSRGTTIALAVLDAVMPKLTGHKVYDRIKLVNPHFPVIFCSGYDPEMSQAELLEGADVRSVQKPYDPDVLLRAVRDLLDARRLLETLSCAI